MKWLSKASHPATTTTSVYTQSERILCHALLYCHFKTRWHHERVNLIHLVNHQRLFIFLFFIVQIKCNKYVFSRIKSLLIEKYDFSRSIDNCQVFIAMSSTKDIYDLTIFMIQPSLFIWSCKGISSIGNPEAGRSWELMFLQTTVHCDICTLHV